MKIKLKHQFLILLAIVVPMFILGAVSGDNRGTTDSYMYRPTMYTTLAGLVYLAVVSAWLYYKKKSK